MLSSLSIQRQPSIIVCKRIISDLFSTEFGINASTSNHLPANTIQRSSLQLQQCHSVYCPRPSYYGHASKRFCRFIIQCSVNRRIHRYSPVQVQIPSSGNLQNAAASDLLHIESGILDAGYPRLHKLLSLDQYRSLMLARQGYNNRLLHYISLNFNAQCFTR